ncbi:MAG: CPBP family intramembrane metalloprotease [Butyrivibrio sp.]|nr:CPBP family intramembrane metalloprotease [Butyrivibrio sp.]
MNRVFGADKDYIEKMKGYTMKDSCVAIAYYIFDIVALYVIGVISSRFHKYYGVQLAIVSIAIIILLVRGKVSKAGINRRKVIPGVVTGLIMGMIFLLTYTIIPGIKAGSKLLPVNAIAYNIFYYFIVISFEEELSFRGFIQPRLFPLFKKEWITILVGGILFVFMHYPFQMATRGMNVAEFFPLFIESAPIQLMWHYVLTWFCRKFGNIYGGTVLHGFIDLSMGIFE